MNEETLVIWNSNAGSVAEAEEFRERLVSEMKATIYEPVSADDARDKVRIAAEHGAKLIVAAGGDGTVNSVINGLVDAPGDVVLGVLPLGTANDWCASLGIPNDLNVAWEILMRRVVEPIDVAELATEARVTRFANIATGGNSNRVTEAITQDMKQRWGAMCYIRGAIGILNDLQSFDTKISFDGGSSEEFSVWNVLVANGRTSAGRVEVAPRAQLNDGLLDVVIIQAGTMVDLAGLSTRYVFADYIESDQVIYRQAREIKLKSQPAINFSLDGDLVDDQPISFHCVPGALQVIIGDEFRSLPGS